MASPEQTVVCIYFRLIMLPELSPSFAEVVVQLAPELQITSEEALTLLSKIPTSLATSRLSIIKSLMFKFVESNQNPTNEYRFTLMERRTFANEGLKLFSDPNLSRVSNRTSIEKERALFNEEIKHIEFQEICLKVINLHLIPALIHVDHKEAERSGITSGLPHNVDPRKVLEVLRRLKNIEPGVDYSNLLGMIDVLLYGFLDPKYIKSNLIDHYSIVDLQPVFNYKIVSDLPNVDLCQKALAETIKAFSNGDWESCLPKGIMCCPENREWPISFIMYWRGVILSLGKEILKLNLPEIVLLVEEACERIAISSGMSKMPLEKQHDQMAKVFIANNIDIDYYWFPFVLLDRSEISLRNVIETYLKAASNEYFLSKMPDDVRFGVVVRLVNSLISLGSSLLKKTRNREPLEVSKTLSQSQIMPSVMHSTFFGEQNFRQASDLFIGLRDRIEKLLDSIERKAHDDPSREAFLFSKRRKEMLVSEFGNLNLNKSITSFQHNK